MRSDILFAVPDDLSTSELNTRINQWLIEVGLGNKTFTVNKNLEEYPIEVKDCYYEFGDKTLARTLEEEEALDRVLETVKLHLKGEKLVPDTLKDIVVVEEEVVSEMTEKVMNRDVADFVNEAMFRLNVMTVTEQNLAMEELYRRVQESRISKVATLEEDIEFVKESSHNLHEIFSRFRPKWGKPRK